jgi:hypothetical protein
LREDEIFGPESLVRDGWARADAIDGELAAARARWPNADTSLARVYEDLLHLARSYHLQTGRHLVVYGEIGELFGAIAYGIRLHRNYACGSDGRLGNDFVEIKTISPSKGKPKVTVRMDRNFSKVLVVRIDEEFRVSGRFVDRSKLPRGRAHMTLNWDTLGQFA